MMKTAQEILEEIRARKGKLDRPNENAVTDEEAAIRNGNASDEQIPPAQDPEGQMEQLTSDQDEQDRNSVSVPDTLADGEPQDSSPGPPASQGSAGDSIGEPPPRRASGREPTGDNPPTGRFPVGGSTPGDSAPNSLSVPGTDRETITGEGPEDDGADGAPGVPPYAPWWETLSRRLEDLALLVADLQGRATMNSEVVDQLAEEVEELRGNLLAQDEDPDEIARRLDEIEGKLVEIESGPRPVEAARSGEAAREFPWWIVALAAGGLFAAALAANRNSPAVPRENTGGAGAPDIATPVAAATPELAPDTPIAGARYSRLPPQLRRLVEQGRLREDEVIMGPDY